MSIYITGDTHGSLSIRKLTRKVFQPDPNSFVIILGDFGLIWSNIPDKEEKHWLKWLDERPWTTLFVDGNHENHYRLDRLPRELKFGGTVGRASDKVFHLRRGNIYTIENKSFFVMGGAKSIDKESRREGVTWWKEEEPNFSEFETALSNLDFHDNKVDYILAHTCPTSISNKYLEYHNMLRYDDGKGDCQVAKFFDEIIKTTKFKDFYFGHWHDDWSYKNFHMLWDKIIKLKE